MPLPITRRLENRRESRNIPIAPEDLVEKVNNFSFGFWMKLLTVADKNKNNRFADSSAIQILHKAV